VAFVDFSRGSAKDARASIDTWLSLLGDAETAVNAGRGSSAALPAIASARSYAQDVRAALPADDGAPISDLDAGNLAAVTNIASAALASADVHVPPSESIQSALALLGAKIQAAAAQGGLALIKALWPLLLLVALVLAVVLTVKRRAAA
jgi:hypothetical protein